jgi:ferredoxin
VQYQEDVMKLYELVRKPPFFLRASHWMTSRDRPVKSGPRSRFAVIIPLLLMQFGSLKAKVRTLARMAGSLWTSLRGMRESAKNIRQNPRTGRRAIDAKTLAELESRARSLGITDIGYTKVNPDFIFRGFEILFDKAIVLTMEMNRDLIATGPGLECTREIWRTYADLGVAVNHLADWLREQGFDCHASPAVGGDINTVPTAQDANLGAVGKLGVLVTPDHGPCVRLAAIFVDIDDLPLAQRREHTWITDFCESCNRCVRECPGDAIYPKPTFLPDGTRTFINREKCAPHFSEGCSTCVSVCPFTWGHHDRIKRAYDRQHPPQVAPVLASGR